MSVARTDLAASDDDEGLRARAERAMDALFADPSWRVAGLVELQARMKLLQMAFDPQAQKAIGRIVAGAAGLERADVAACYRAAVREALGGATTRGRHVNVLEHAAGYFKTRDADHKRALHDAIAGYARGDVALATVRDLLRVMALADGVDWIEGQLYLT